jgi:hypothetical protein
VPRSSGTGLASFERWLSNDIKLEEKPKGKRSYGNDK